jgi:ligand-binding SRPBCC domain-containing protein
MTVRIEVETLVAATPEVVFDLSLDMDVHQASLPGSHERAIAGVTTGLIGLGESVTLRARHFGVPFTMTSRVTEFDRPRRFVDRQVRGPFRSWVHEHAYVARPGGGTVMTDRIDFEAPAGLLGRAVEAAVLARYMRRLIEGRGAYLKAEAERRGRGSGAGDSGGAAG